MSRWERGVVIGKFYPPHRGHRHLIETAAAQVRHLDVIVCARPDQTIAGSLRARWLREIHAAQPNVRVIELEDICDDDNSERWAAYTIESLGYHPDVVFTSESYGEHYARSMDAEHVMVDRARTVVSASSTAIRLDPLGRWNDMEPGVRAYYALRIAVVGAESTGTTTTARMLAERFGTVLVPEYGRLYWEQNHRSGDRDWRSEEFTHIATEQIRLEDELAREADRIVICDTEALATSVWHERYIGAASEAVRALAWQRTYDLYLLTSDDIAFEQDGTRDGEHIRGWMTQRFREILTERGAHWMELRGDADDRLQVATQAINDLLRARRTHDVASTC